MRKRVGYFDGTDSALLTELICDGYDTVPVSNGLDNHGQSARLINAENRYDLLIAPLHKIYAAEVHPDEVITYQEVFRLCRTYSIPLLIAVPEALQERAIKLLGELPDVVRFADRSDMIDIAHELLRD